MTASETGATAEWVGAACPGAPQKTTTFSTICEAHQYRPTRHQESWLSRTGFGDQRDSKGHEALPVALAYRLEPERVLAALDDRGKGRVAPGTFSRCSIP